MDKKLTDSEIVKALECCMNGHCDDCPFKETREHCHNLDSLILDLINRLQAKNKKLTEILFNLKTGSEVYKTLMCDDLEYLQIKAEAYNEFAERLKEKAEPHYFDNTHFAVHVEEIDNLLKEFGGGK